MMSKGSRESVSKKQGSQKPNGWKYMTPWERVRNLVGLSIFLIPTVYAFLWFFLATPVNKAFHYPKECTIEFAAAAESRSRSYSGSRFVVVRTSDCGDLRFKGDRHGLSRSEVADRIDALAGQRVRVDVGVWQLPGKGDDSIVGIEGLDLSK